MYLVYFVTSSCFLWVKLFFSFMFFSKIFRLTLRVFQTCCCCPTPGAHKWVFLRWTSVFLNVCLNKNSASTSVLKEKSVLPPKYCSVTYFSQFVLLIYCCYCCFVSWIMWGTGDKCVELPYCFAVLL